MTIFGYDIDVVMKASLLLGWVIVSTLFLIYANHNYLNNLYWYKKGYHYYKNKVKIWAGLNFFALLCVISSIVLIAIS
ncbi:hypothetical protein [Caminibacter pacificus]|uniref:Uncharacterized protein n=1 Tax=Caminibacter pacificus TaxID=1424653 RepID=A0AAJ4UX62_9BACT|nr:hypothetical protein [Caminibacter pacificus]QDD68216.1 hypothetical protein C6V80_10195 [Caminibacter pacificus]ROR38730.1 hypothetical protein EDC58_1945 [Caminibacter pacificus]